jgi:hypothetical protein
MEWQAPLDTSSFVELSATEIIAAAFNSVLLDLNDVKTMANFGEGRMWANC